MRRTAAYGSVGEYGEWKAALEEYYWDRLEHAFELAIALGVGVTGAMEGWFRMIEGETLTRRESEIARANEWLQVEARSHDEGLLQIAVEACEEVAVRFGTSRRPPTFLSVLAEEADAPWSVARFGYMVDKYPYDKICVPAASVQSAHGFAEVVAHEYAHVVVLDVAQGRAPHWLNEAVAMLAERSSDLRMRRAFADGSVPWLSPRELERAHTAPRQGEPNPARTWRAYQQSAWIGRFLVEQGGDTLIGQILSAFSDNSVWTELRMRATGQTPAEEALRQVLGYGETELFNYALTWIRR